MLTAKETDHAKLQGSAVGREIHRSNYYCYHYHYHYHYFHHYYYYYYHYYYYYYYTCSDAKWGTRSCGDSKMGNRSLRRK